MPNLYFFAKKVQNNFFFFELRTILALDFETIKIYGK